MRDRWVAINIISAAPEEQVAWLESVEFKRVFLPAQDRVEISRFAHPDILLARIARHIFEPVFAQKIINEAGAIDSAVCWVGGAVCITEILLC